MSNRAWIGAGVIAMLIGCRATGQPGPPRTEARASLDEAAAPGTPTPRAGGFAAVPQDAGTEHLVCPPGTVEVCPDPHNCTCGNGTGVYAAEGGFAGITVRMAGDGFTEQTIMITHFINARGPNGPNVTFAYGYFAPATSQWHSLGIGNVDSADYLQNSHTVISVGETNTVPTWTLGTPGSRALLQAKDLQNLKLHISFTVLSGGIKTQKTATLDFDAATPNTIGGNVKQPLSQYNMRWTNPDYSNKPSQQYCHGPSQQPDDMAVFQQGIDVDPVTGTVAHLNSGNFVTVSCSLGAPAMVYSWGYPYKGSDTDTFYFDAGIHMKRASYCGDMRYYTWAGTPIHLLDSKVAHGDPLPPPGVEAWWDRSGAICVSSEHMRHPELAPSDINLMTCGGQPYQPGISLSTCSFRCKGKDLPKCPSSAPPQPPWPQFLGDGP